MNRRTFFSAIVALPVAAGAVALAVQSPKKEGVWKRDNYYLNPTGTSITWGPRGENFGLQEGDIVSVEGEPFTHFRIGPQA